MHVLVQVCVPMCMHGWQLLALPTGVYQVCVDMQKCQRPVEQSGSPTIIQEPIHLANLVNRLTAEWHLASANAQHADHARGNGQPAAS